MAPEQVIYREEVTALPFSVYDMLEEIRSIRELLEDDGEEEEGLSD